MEKKATAELTLEEKRRKVKEALLKKGSNQIPTAFKKSDLIDELEKAKALSKHVNKKEYYSYTYDMFMNSMGRKTAEMSRLKDYIDTATEDRVYAFGNPRLSAQKTEVEIEREAGEVLKVLNFSSYNYLGFGYHPEVIQAAKDALDEFGLGAASSPVISGTLSIHKKLENDLTEFFGLPDYGVSLFSSGYGAVAGSISAFIKPGGYVILDSSAHMCMLEGAQLSKANIAYFRHNSPEHLEEILKPISNENTRALVCVEGVYSAKGDFGKVEEIIAVAKKYGAYVLVDEAHSMLLDGDKGRGVCEARGMLDKADLILITFSKAFGGVGGALYAKSDITEYVNLYAKCRMFSCALDPAVTAGMTKVLELASGKEGDIRRERLKENSSYLRTLLKDKVHIGESASWIIPVKFKQEKLTMEINDYLQRQGLDSSIMQFPAVPKNEAVIRLFVTSEHNRKQLEEASEIIFKAAEKFNFLK